MLRKALLTMAIGLMLQGIADAQTSAWQFRWQAGQVLKYRVEQITSATEVIGGRKTSTTTKLNLVKRWQNLGPEKAKLGTRLALSLAELHIETTKATGEVLSFDSANPDNSSPGMREQLTPLVGKTLAVIRVDASGNVLEVIQSKHGPASRFESELPFVLILPARAPAVGQSWERAYHITLEPPQGVGEKFDAKQKYEYKGLKNGYALIRLTTAIAKMPPGPADRVPLLQAQPEGEILFDPRAGRLQAATLRIDQELTGQQGLGSSYRLQSRYTETYVGNK
jgi:hypothetical protein